MHAINLSHTNFMGLINSFISKKLELPHVNFNNIFKKDEKKKEKKNFIQKIQETTPEVLNVLSLMDNNIGDYFLFIEYYLKNTDGELNIKNILPDFDFENDTIVLTPLIMDFGHNEEVDNFQGNTVGKFINRYLLDNNLDNVFYNLPSQKPVILQTADLFQGINRYNKYNLSVDKKTKKVSFTENKGEHKLFEIYPFMGINPNSYVGEEKKLEKHLNKYFSNYKDANSPIDLYNKIKDSSKKFNGDIYDKQNEFNFLFAGIKLYPSLNFDPAPADGTEEKKLNDFFFSYCSEKQIPITTHCSDGGAKTIPEQTSWNYTSPKAWAKVLKEHNNLKINFAHFGEQGNGSEKEPKLWGNWKEIITDLINKYPNVYTDISCRCMEVHFFKKFNTDLKKVKKERVLFGTDLPVNLFENCKSSNSKSRCCLSKVL